MKGREGREEREGRRGEGKEEDKIDGRGKKVVSWMLGIDAPAFIFSEL